MILGLKLETWFVLFTQIIGPLLCVLGMHAIEFFRDRKVIE